MHVGIARIASMLEQVFSASSKPELPPGLMSSSMTQQDEQGDIRDLLGLFPGGVVK